MKVEVKEPLAAGTVFVLRQLLAEAMAQATADKARRGMADYLRKAVEAHCEAMELHVKEFARVYPAPEGTKDGEQA